MESSQSLTRVFHVNSQRLNNNTNQSLWVNKRSGGGARTLIRLQSLARLFLMLIFRKTWLSEVVKANIWNCYLGRGGHAATVGTAQGDRCSRGPAQQAGKTIPLISHLIPLSTGPRSQSETNMLITPVYIRPLGSVGLVNKRNRVRGLPGSSSEARQKKSKRWPLKKTADTFVILRFGFKAELECI